jgi:hypothetical protein
LGERINRKFRSEVDKVVNDEKGRETLDLSNIQEL